MNPRNSIILCVDDEEANLKLLENILVPRGYEVVSAASGKDALLKIKSQTIDLVLLDIMMPGIDGFEVCRQMKEDQKLRNIPVIMITALTDKQDRIRGIEAGAEEFLSKPFDQTEALARIKILLKVKELNDARACAEKALQKSHDELDWQVQERTAELAQANTILQADITERKRREEEREILLQDLGERVKELGCINDISRLAEEHWISIEEFVPGAVGILPPAWRYPEICAARIMLDSKEFKTANFRETEWSQVADIKVDRKKFGAVTICYLEEKPAADEGPFLKEERSLINTVADFLGHIIQHRLSEAEIRVSEEKLQYIAYHDSLTGLPNRSLFFERINKKIAEAKDSSSSIAVVITDINKFKSICDIYGSEIGDRVLKGVAERLSASIRKGDIAAHLGNDAFGIACMGVTGSDDIIMLEKIINDISSPLKIGGDEIIPTFSTGISLYPHDGESASELLKSAGLALGIAKKEGRKASQFYSIDMKVMASEIMLLEKQLVTAIKNEEFLLHYQPYWDITTKKMVGMEALIRWQSKDKGLVPPGKFIPVLEDTGMIIEVGEWILREAIRQVKEWQNNGHPVVPVSVNMSLVQFRQKNLAEMVKKIMGECGFYPSLLALEITESAFMQNIEFTKWVLTEMKEIGCSVSIDDFGTGYSSLSYLKRFPIDNLKIDISFIRDMVKDPDSASIVMAIINMAHTLNLKTIAEGIETEEQWNFLRLLRCDMGQGFYLSKPLPPEEVEKLLI